VADASASPRPSRAYGGRSAEERQSERRARLVAAGLECFGTDGLRSTTIRQLCQTAGLNERYFYESFRTREELLAAVYEDLLDDLVGRVVRAVSAAPPEPLARARAGLEAFAETLASDHRRARVQLLEVVGVDEELERRRRARMHQFAELIEAIAGELIDLSHVDPDRRRLTAMALVGATNELLIDWFLDPGRTPLARVVDTAVDLYDAAARRLAATG
jgi:AcrR family transcriptional regulator